MMSRNYNFNTYIPQVLNITTSLFPSLLVDSLLLPRFQATGASKPSGNIWNRAAGFFTVSHRP